MDNISRNCVRHPAVTETPKPIGNRAGRSVTEHDLQRRGPVGGTAAELSQPCATFANYRVGGHPAVARENHTVREPAFGHRREAHHHIRSAIAWQRKAIRCDHSKWRGEIGDRAAQLPATRIGQREADLRHRTGGYRPEEVRHWTDCQLSGQDHECCHGRIRGAARIAEHRAILLSVVGDSGAEAVGRITRPGEIVPTASGIGTDLPLDCRRWRTTRRRTEAG